MRLYVRNFRNGTQEERLERLFSKYGYVEDVIIWWHSGSRQFKAYVEMPEDQAERAMNKLNGYYWHGQRLKVTKEEAEN